MSRNLSDVDVSSGMSVGGFSSVRRRDKLAKASMHLA